VVDEGKDMMTGVLYVKAFVPVTIPPGVVITTFTELAVPRAGVNAVMEVALFTV
jgi:hypothetical protein